MAGFYAASSIAAAGNSAAPAKASRPRMEPMPCPPRNAHRPHRRQRPVIPPPPPPPAAAPAPTTPARPFVTTIPAAAAPGVMNLAKTVGGSVSAADRRAFAAAVAQHLCADPLTDAARARPYGAATSEAGLNYSSSGSVHDPLSSVCLAAMVHHYFVEEEEARAGSCGRARCNCLDGACGGDAGNDSSSNEEADEGGLSPASSLPEEHLCEILEGVSSLKSNRELLLLFDVGKAMEEEVELLAPSENLSIGEVEKEEENGVDEALVVSRLRRPVMKRLQQAGHNAGLCKSRWNRGDGLPAGEYDYVDIVINAAHDNDDHRIRKHSDERFIVDIDFKAQFEIARASEQYTRLLSVLPRIFVGKPERLQQIIKIMSNAAKRSLKKQGLHLPPWRKQRYMQAKWFSTYKRTTNAQESSTSDRLNFSIGMRGPRLMSMELTKEMDMAFFRAQAKAMQQQADSRRLGKTLHQRRKDQEEDTGVVDNPARDYVIGLQGNYQGDEKLAAGFVAYTLARRTSRDECTVMCTGWQPPALSRKGITSQPIETCMQQQMRHNRGRSSGLAYALNNAASSAATPQHH